MNQFRKIAYPYVAWIAVMVLAPMLMIVLYAFIQQGNDVTTFKFTLENFTRFFSDKVYTDVLYRSLYVALVTTAVCLVIGYPAAYIIAMAKPKNKALLVLMITFPTWINMLGAYIRMAWYPSGRRYYKFHTYVFGIRRRKDDIYGFCRYTRNGI